MKRKNKIKYQVLQYVKHKCEEAIQDNKKVDFVELIYKGSEKFKAKAQDVSHLHYLIICDITKHSKNLNLALILKQHTDPELILRIIEKIMDIYKYDNFPKFHDKVLFPTKWSKTIWSLLNESDKNAVFETYNTCFRYRMWKIFCKTDITFTPFNLLKLPTQENIIKVNKYHKTKSNICSQCGSELIHIEGCNRCFNCGWSSCNL